MTIEETMEAIAQRTIGGGLPELDTIAEELGMDWPELVSAVERWGTTHPAYAGLCSLFFAAGATWKESQGALGVARG